MSRGGSLRHVIARNRRQPGRLLLLGRSMQIAGLAYTVMAGPDIREPGETPSNPKLDNFAVFDRVYEGCAVVVAAAGERQSGIWGELVSNASRVRGATGIVIDGGIRDGPTSR